MQDVAELERHIQKDDSRQHGDDKSLQSMRLQTMFSRSNSQKTVVKGVISSRMKRSNTRSITQKRFQVAPQEEIKGVAVREAWRPSNRFAASIPPPRICNIESLECSRPFNTTASLSIYAKEERRIVICFLFSEDHHPQGVMMKGMASIQRRFLTIHKQKANHFPLFFSMQIDNGAALSNGLLHFNDYEKRRLTHSCRLPLIQLCILGLL
ncbi:hypothetical protein TNCV_4702271 [Trichonephila clavipes]|nr:hypothetical protein TNCV_4702271 [Trichonephila clavipes]